MPSAMVTFNGRITLPNDIRKQLGIKTGDNIDFVEIEKGRFAICTRPSTVAAVETAGSVPFRAADKPMVETVQ